MAFKLKLQYLLVLLFFLGVFLVFYISQPKAVEIIIEYTFNCSGYVDLTLSPTITNPGLQIIANATNLSACNNTVVYFRNNTCTGPNLNQCTIDQRGLFCSATITAPSPPTLPQTYTVAACININKDGDFGDPGESKTRTYQVVSAVTTPVVGSLKFTDGVKQINLTSPLNVNTGSSEGLFSNASITDSGGCSGHVTSCTGYLWNSTVGSSLTLSNVRYTNSSCAITSTPSCLCTCYFNIQYYDVNGTWTGNITARDTNFDNGTNRATFNINPNGGVQYSSKGVARLIEFTTLSIGDVNRPASSNPLNITNIGNTNLKLKVSGTDQVGTIDFNQIVGVGNTSYNSSISGLTTLTALTKTPVNFYPSPNGLPVYPNTLSGMAGNPATMTMYLYLSIPLGTYAQSYRGNLTIDW